MASPETLEVLAACHVSRKAAVSDGILPTKLYCTNANVDAENAARLAALPGESVSFHAGDVFRGGGGGSSSSSDNKKLMELAERKALRSLELKVGAQVVLTVNRPSLGLVNGSRGVVVGLQRDCAVSEGDKEAFGVAAGKYDVPVVRFDDGKTRAVKPSQFFQGGGGGGGRCSGRRSL